MHVQAESYVVIELLGELLLGKYLDEVVFGGSIARRESDGG